MRKFIFLILISIVMNISVFSYEFKYNFSESYRIESTVYQNVLFNRKIELSSVILNKYSVNLIENYNTSALLDVSHHVFQESKGLASGYYTVHQSEKGEILQESNGNISKASNKFFPSVQSIPFFPSRDIKIGESWTAEAKEFFDLKNGFGIDDVIIANFRVFYTYSGNKVIDNIECAIININYNIYEKIQPYIDWGDFYPTKISGSSKEILYWDIKKGRPYKADDQFVIDFFTSTGDQYTFKGNTTSNTWPKNNLNTDNIRNLVTNLEKNPQTTVKESDDSLIITFNSLLFDAESSILMDSSKNYLDEIGQTLKSMGDVNIRILGHTALFGETNEEYLKNLSLSRARSVADYLVKNKYIDINGIEILGQGGDYPVESNETHEGRSKNRRVELEILKN